MKMQMKAEIIRPAKTPTIGAIGSNISHSVGATNKTGKNDPIEGKTRS
jgi:hypothetical protein